MFDRDVYLVYQQVADGLNQILFEFYFGRPVLLFILLQKLLDSGLQLLLLASLVLRVELKHCLQVQVLRSKLLQRF